MKTMLGILGFVLAFVMPAQANSDLDLLAIAPDGSYQQLKGHPTLQASRILQFGDGIYRPVLLLGFQSFFNYTGKVFLAFKFDNTIIPGSGDTWLYPGAYGFAGFVLPEIYGAHRASFSVLCGNGVHKRANMLVNNQRVTVPEPETWMLIAISIPTLFLARSVLLRI